MIYENFTVYVFYITQLIETSILVAFQHYEMY
jgi:hypothetical protein